MFASILNSSLSPECFKLWRFLIGAGHEVRMAGGAVRDFLAGLKPSDIDFASTATPEETIKVLEEHKVQIINPFGGMRHGTVTARIDYKQKFEITTLRTDTDTDGRRATVEFTKDWKLDAYRRDLTINSMYIDIDGNLYDYFNGQEDLIHKRVQFVGDAGKRIREDYLRILRYFRIYGKVASNPERHDQKTINEIIKNASGLQQISGERIWMEWKKILSGSFGSDLTLKMIECQLGSYIGLPQNPNIKGFRSAWNNTVKDNISTLEHPISLLATLLYSEDDVLHLHSRLKMSRIERDLCLFFTNHISKIDPISLSSIQWLYLSNPMKIKTEQVKSYINAYLLAQGLKDLNDEFDKWKPPTFPINRYDLISAKCPKGQLISIITDKLKVIWRDSNYTMGRKELLNEIPNILDVLPSQSLPSKTKNKKVYCRVGSNVCIFEFGGLSQEMW
ncbi:CCA tRNA nucleotidyltransferase 1, mitochondrial isoform X1 [Lepeophtheirus salmonis]|uniref:CCA tRNA nucleotidyltransferase 1, mitochondrial isoform X1 n=2 Tax=Lepeophtheirus salmonis TaxID=72036 RepID=UPI001AE0EE1D|nr:CCA tRNA nucleotidyltransferase 1, mitochondrial-like [Lepeophtheirus salmonis]